MQVSAADAAFGKVKSFPSTFYLESTLDANRHVHPLSIMHYLGTECSAGYERFFTLSNAALDRVSLADSTADHRAGAAGGSNTAGGGAAGGGAAGDSNMSRGATFWNCIG